MLRCITVVLCWLLVFFSFSETVTSMVFGKTELTAVPCLQIFQCWIFISFVLKWPIFNKSAWLFVIKSILPLLRKESVLDLQNWFASSQIAGRFTSLPILNSYFSGLNEQHLINKTRRCRLRVEIVNWNKESSWAEYRLGVQDWRNWTNQPYLFAYKNTSSFGSQQKWL